MRLTKHIIISDSEEQFSSSYNFNNNLHTDVRALIPLIAIHGDNLVGAEIGVWKGDAFMTLLHNCPNIKTLHGVDLFQPYYDYLAPGVFNSNQPSITYDRKEIEFIKLENKTLLTF